MNLLAKKIILSCQVEYSKLMDPLSQFSITMTEVPTTRRQRVAHNISEVTLLSRCSKQEHHSSMKFSSQIFVPPFSPIAIEVMTSKQLMHTVQCHYTHDPKSNRPELKAQINERQREVKRDIRVFPLWKKRRERPESLRQYCL